MTQTQNNFLTDIPYTGRNLDGEWWLYLEDKTTIEVMNIFYELTDCYNLAVSMQYLVDTVWNYLIYMIDHDQQSRVIEKGKESLNLLDKICGKMTNNIDALCAITKYIDDLEDGIYWDQVLNKINNAKKEEN